MGAYCFAVVVGLTSLPSLSLSMTWREIRVVQSRLGWVLMVLASTHILAATWDKLGTFKCYVPSSGLLPMLPAFLAFALKIPLIVMDRRLTSIRRGREYNGCCSLV